MLLRLSRRFDGEFPAKRFEEVIERIRELTHDPGSVELTDKSLVWSSSPDRHPIQSHLMVRLMVSEAGPTKTPDPNRRDVAYFTTLTITDRLGALVGRLYGAFGTILGAGGAAAPVAASIAFPAFTPLFVIGWLGGVYGTTRLLYHRIADGRSRRLQDIFGALARDVEIWINGADS